MTPGPFPHSQLITGQLFVRGRLWEYFSGSPYFHRSMGAAAQYGSPQIVSHAACMSLYGLEHL